MATHCKEIRALVSIFGYKQITKFLVVLYKFRFLTEQNGDQLNSDTLPFVISEVVSIVN